MMIHTIVKTFILSLVISLAAYGQENELKAFRPGDLWPDTDGTHINAHGGGILYNNGTYYWFGEHKGQRNNAFVGVMCYSSSDLYNWKKEGVALAFSEDPASEITRGCVMERPKVIYNERTGKFVMWFHLELKGQGYSAARTGVAVSEKPSGPFEYIRSYRPNAGQWPQNFKEEWKTSEVKLKDLEWWTEEWHKEVRKGLFVRKDFEKGQMSRDMTVYVDEGGTAYHIHSAEENLTLHISELTGDYLDFTGKYVIMQPGGHNEAPAIFKRGEYYYMITSGCTGWDPNAARSFRSKSVLGPWEALGNPCVGKDADLTFQSQSTYILPVPGKENALIFIADRWRPGNPIDGRYVWLPIQFQEGRPRLIWYDQWDLSFFDEKK